MTTQRISPLFALLLFVGCAAKAPSTEAAKTEAAPATTSASSSLDACQSYATSQYVKTRVGEFGSIVLDAETAQEEASALSVGSQAVSAVLSGEGVWQGVTGEPQDVEFTCLLSDAKTPVYFGIQEQGPGDAVKVCWDGFGPAEWGPLTECLEAALKREEEALAAELKKATEQAGQSLDKLSAEKILAESNAQWATYRDGECDRRMAAVAGRNHPDIGELTCKIELTANRIADFQFDAE